MIRNYFKITWRNLVKDRQFTLLNLTGLSTGLACAFLIYLWVADETGMDTFQQKSGQLYQVMQNVPLGNGGTMTTESTEGLLAGALKKEIPEVEDAAIVRLPAKMEDARGIMTFGNEHIKAREMYVTSNFPAFFSFPLLEGSPGTAFTNMYGVVITEDAAMKLFHTTKNIIGKTVDWDRGHGGSFSKDVNGLYTITGVFKNLPQNSSMQFDAVFNYDAYFAKYKHYLDNWGSSNPATFVLLKNGANLQRVNAKLYGFVKAKWKATHGNQDIDYIGTLFLQPYTEKYLHNHYENGAIAGGRIEYVKLFSVIAIFILAIACINFMNLATARASRRMKETGIRKVMGARRGELILQYMGESLLMSFAALTVAIILTVLLLPAFKQITGKNLGLHFSGGIVLGCIGITLLTGLIAGSYPALYLSGFKPALVLKGKLSTNAGEPLVRKALVAFQFTISVMLIVCVLVVYKQMQLVQNKNLGYNKSSIVHFACLDKDSLSQATFLANIKSIPGVINATNCRGDFMGNHSGGSGINWPGKTPAEGVEFSGLYANYGFVETMGLHIVQGRAFSKQFGDTTPVLFNQAAIAAMHLKDPVGKTITMWGNKKQIVGIVQDFNFESLYQKIGPLFITLSQQNNTNMFVKLQPTAEKAAIEKIRSLYKQYTGGVALEYTFLDDDYNAMYASEQRVAVLSRYFAGLAIIISCLGLFGLAAFTAQKRQKEIGIRKVIGASVTGIAAMLSADFLRLVLISVFIAFPLAWWAMHSWLQSFAFRVNIGVGIFAAAGGSIIAITICTVSFQAVKAAVANPVVALKSE